MPILYAITNQVDADKRVKIFKKMLTLYSFSINPTILDESSDNSALLDP